MDRIFFFLNWILPSLHMSRALCRYKFCIRIWSVIHRHGPWISAEICRALHMTRYNNPVPLNDFPIILGGWICWLSSCCPPSEWCEVSRGGTKICILKHSKPSQELPFYWETKCHIISKKESAQTSANKLYCKWGAESILKELAKLMMVFIDILVFGVPSLKHSE